MARLREAVSRLVTTLGEARFLPTGHCGAATILLFSPCTVDFHEGFQRRLQPGIHSNEGQDMQFRCPNCQQPIQIELPDERLAEAPTIDSVECPSCHSRFSLSGGQESTLKTPVGMQIAHFEIHEILGEGAFGTVYRAWDTQLRRFVALKVPRQGRITRETSRQFLREAQTAAAITHTNVVAVYEIGQHEGSYYIATELIDGITLSEFLKQKKFAAKEAAELMIKVLKGIQVFHDKGIIHRDLKPGNILLDAQQEPHISDFGLARYEALPEITVTQSGKLVGTLLYMSPEQARGESRSLSSRTDIYTAGVILFELLTGQRPFVSTSSRNLLFRILSDPPPSLRKLDHSIPRDLETICLKAMEKDALNRFDSAREMAENLQLFIDGKPLAIRPVSVPEKFWRLVVRHKVVSGLLAAVFVLLGFITYRLMFGSEIRIVKEPGEVIMVKPEPLRHPVRLTYSLSGNQVPPNAIADWAILPLDTQSREPAEAEAIRIRQSNVANADLLPGEYLIVVNVPGFGFHEVYRTVPEDKRAEAVSPYKHGRWNVDSDGTVLLPEISIRAEPDVLAGMVAVPGGQFEMGDGEPLRFKHLRAVDSFYVDPRETTANEFGLFSALGPSYQWPVDDHAVCVHWNAAVGFAEFMGKRLLKEHEFEYLARDLGKSDFPSGEESAVNSLDIWTYPNAGQPQNDQMASLPVFGLHSNVAEWTDSLLNPYPGDAPRTEEEYRFLNLMQSRVVRGGPVTAGPNDRSQNTWKESVRFRMAWDVRTADSEIGFRCGRSSRPRFQ
ncbi:MAG: protein kinase [Planctomyces sp.]|nr:protein kinase [Planctomyces sp.]